MNLSILNLCHNGLGDASLLLKLFLKKRLNLMDKSQPKAGC